MFEACPIGEVNRQYRWEQDTECYRVQEGCTGYVDVDMDSVRNERRDARIRCDHACKGGDRRTIFIVFSVSNLVLKYMIAYLFFYFIF